MSIIILTSKPVFAEIKADCLGKNDKWKSCHLDFNNGNLKWRLKNTAVWFELPGHSITRIVQSLPSKQVGELVVGLDLNQVEGSEEILAQNIKSDQDKKSYPFYIPLEWQNMDKSVLAIEYAVENGEKSILFLALSIKDEFVLKLKLESLSGQVIQKVYGR